MAEFRIVHEFDADPQSFWRVFLDSEFQTEMYRSAGVKRVEKRREDLGDSLIVVANCGTDWDLPAALRSVLGGKALGYVETLTFSKRRGDGEARQQIELTVMRDRVHFEGSVTLERIGPARVRRRYSGTVRIELPLIGKKLEQSTASAMQHRHDAAAQLMRVWLAKGAA